MESIVTHEVGKLGMIREPVRTHRPYPLPANRPLPQHGGLLTVVCCVVSQRPAPLMSATPFQMGGPAPERGEHTLEILEELGYSAEKRRALRETNVFGAYADE